MVRTRYANLRVAVASMTGIAAGYAHIRRLTREQALAELGDVVDACDVDHAGAVQLLTEAAALYVDRGPDDPWPWSADAAELLADAGADLERAAVMAASRRRRRPAPSTA